MEKKNINISGFNPCSSCGVCVISCPVSAISFQYNQDGFYQPEVDEPICIDCGLCQFVCYKYLKPQPVARNVFEDKEIDAAWSNNPVTVKTTSSGGVTAELTRHFYHNNHQVCGAIFDADNDLCKHIIAESEQDLEKIKTSKYLQSYTVEAFSQFSKKGKYLVVGTPCQLYGLRKWIQKKKVEENFILVDFFCHGTPSFNLWKKYKKHLIATKNLDENFKIVNFRSKEQSTWHKNSMQITDSNNKTYLNNNAFAQDLFFRFFLSNSCLSEACYRCQLRLDHCESDIRVADFWGGKYDHNETGVSLVIINTEKGKSAWNEVKPLLTVESCTFTDLKASQGSRYFEKYKKSESVLSGLRSESTLSEVYCKTLKVRFPIIRKIIRKICR